ncbi:MAG: Hpt domain-containing protein [Gammaproteobacteria bacterium]|jgi:HPt (histidine-containing phosphotransfer) domain-containing protein
MNSVVYNRQAALERAGGDLNRARRFLDLLLESFTQAERSLSQALDRNDMNELLGNAHKLAGAASYCGAEAVREAASRLETRAREGATESNAALTRDLLDQIVRFRQATANER